MKIVIPPISRDEQIRLMGGAQTMVTKKARNRLGVEAVRNPSQHADGSKRRRRKSKRERDALKSKEQRRTQHVPKDGTQPRPKTY